jgi:hypothetical protein
MIYTMYSIHHLPSHFRSRGLHSTGFQRVAFNRVSEGCLQQGFRGLTSTGFQRVAFNRVSEGCIQQGFRVLPSTGFQRAVTVQSG